MITRTNNSEPTSAFQGLETFELTLTFDSTFQLPLNGLRNETAPGGHKINEICTMSK